MLSEFKLRHYAQTLLRVNFLELFPMRSKLTPEVGSPADSERLLKVAVTQITKPYPVEEISYIERHT
jgi:hypothetical protein